MPRTDRLSITASANPIIRVADVAGFSAAFGDVGMKVGPRTGPDKRTQADKEWFVVRRFLEAALRSGSFKAPFSIQKGVPPAPDFIVQFESKELLTFIEITEATDPADQREMTESELSNETATLLGTFGGRFAEGASQPGIVWATDILDAIQRKDGKSIYSRSGERHLVIYPNSNASILLFGRKDERTAFKFLFEAISTHSGGYAKLVNGCSVHVLGAHLVCFDILGEGRLVERPAHDPMIAAGWI